jgi:hypothetical protein
MMSKLNLFGSILLLPSIMLKFSSFLYACFLLVKNTRKISYNRNPVKNSFQILSYHHKNGNLLNRTSMDIDLFNTNLLDEI